MRETAVGDVFHTESYLTTEGDALRCAERRQSCVAGVYFAVIVITCRAKKRLEVAL